MEFRILGELDVLDSGTQIRLGGVTRRAVLGYLLLHNNQVVPASQLREALWNDDPPATSRKIVQNAVSAIRKVLACHESAAGAVLLTQDPGYLLRVDPDVVDLCLFRQLVQRGNAELASGEAELARVRFRQAIGMWRGRALSDLAEIGIRWSELTAIEDERLNAYEACFEAELASGRNREITPELKVLTAAVPARETFCKQYMLALYRSGRQADALEAYQRARGVLVERLGIEPRLDLQRLHQMILSQDPDLEFVSSSSPSGPWRHIAAR
ncbi:AfsR/SARP family transcriptional regulator [Nocardia sp. NPDC050712]|uniref:AfsR/SARP family transcriptional regulator n=1 Tax=Nocardia sp. NPDC050712 TaxID=3155518 RepID=UPI003410AFE5